MPTVIDSLIVSLGLDPAKYVAGIAAAEAKTNQFAKALKKLGIEESSLNEDQKAGLDVLRQRAVEADQRQRKEQEASRAKAAAAKETRNREIQQRRETLEFQKKQRKNEKIERDADKKKIQAQRELEVTSQRTRKELAAGFQQFKGFIEAGAATFGVALTVGAALDYGLNTIRGLNQIGYQAPQAGMAPTEASALLQAMQGMGLPTGGALGTIQALNAELNAPGNANAPSASLLKAAALLGVNPGSLWGAGGKPIPVEEALLKLADPIQKMGQARAASLLPFLDPGLLAFLGKGRAADEAALAEARKTAPSGADVAEAQKAAGELGKLSVAANAAGRALVLLGAPALVNGLIHLLGMLNYWRTGEDAEKYEREQKLKILGPGAVAEDDADAAMAALNQSYAAKAPPDKGTDFFSRIVNWDAGPAPATPPPPAAPKRWNADDERARIMDLIAGGMSPSDAAKKVMGEEAAGGPPKRAAQSGTRPSAALLDAVLTVESGGNNNAVSPKGALGPYQFMPETWAQYGEGDPRNPVAAREAASKYLTDLFAHYGDWQIAEGAYHSGQNNMDSYIAQDKTTYGDAWRDHLMEFLPPKTAAYLPAVARALNGAAPGEGGDVTIGAVNIYPPNGDAKTIARSIKPALHTAMAESGAR